MKTEHLQLQECGLDKFECVIAELADMGMTVAEVIGILRMTEHRLLMRWSSLADEP